MATDADLTVGKGSKDLLMNTAAPFPFIIDSTMLDDFRRCPTKWLERYINCLGAAGEDVNLMFGSCVAKGLEVTRKEHYTNGKPAAEAITSGICAAVKRWGNFDEPQGHAKNVTNLIMALDGYFQAWPLHEGPFPLNDNSIEFSFSVPLGIGHPDNPEIELMYGGRFDLLCSDGQMIFPLDDKTTGSPFFNRSNGWNLWGQFIGYQWACRKMQYDVRQLLARGIFVEKNSVKYMPQYVQTTDAVIDRWLRDLYYTIDQMISMYRDQFFPRVYGTACKVYSVCTYLPLCEATRREDWISWYKRIEQWNPLNKPGGEL